MVTWLTGHRLTPLPPSQHSTALYIALLGRDTNPKFKVWFLLKFKAFGICWGCWDISPLYYQEVGVGLYISKSFSEFFFLYSSTLDPEVNPSLIWSLRANTEIWWVSPPTFLTVSTTQSLFTHTWAQSLLRLWRRPNSKRSEDFWCLKSSARINSQAQPRIISGTLAINSSFQVSVSLSLNWANNNTYKMELLIFKY